MRRPAAVLLALALALGLAACGDDEDPTLDSDVEAEVEEEESEDTGEEPSDTEEMEEPAAEYDAAVAASACQEFSSTTIDAENAEDFREIANQDGMPADLQSLLLQLVDAGEASDTEAAEALFPEVDALCTQYMAEAG